MLWWWFVICPVLQLECGSRGCISGVLWESRSGSGGDEMEASSPPNQWYILWVTQAPCYPACATKKGLSGWVVVEQKAYANCSDLLLQTSWSLMYLLRSVCVIPSTSKIFFPLTNSGLQMVPIGIEIPGRERTAPTIALGLSLSLEAGVW